MKLKASITLTVVSLQAHISESLRKKKAWKGGWAFLGILVVLAADKEQNRAGTVCMALLHPPSAWYRDSQKYSLVGEETQAHSQPGHLWAAWLTWGSYLTSLSFRCLPYKMRTKYPFHQVVVRIKQHKVLGSLSHVVKTLKMGGTIGIHSCIERVLTQ